MAERERPKLRGGKKGGRDRLYGLEQYPDVKNFLRWWHRREKRYTGTDLDAQTAASAYEERVQLGRPEVS